LYWVQFQYSVTVIIVLATLDPSWASANRNMGVRMTRFPSNDIISLVGTTPRYDLGESVGPDLRLSELVDASGHASLDEMPLGYGTAEGDPRLRKAIAELHHVDPDDVVVTMGGMQALFLIAFILFD